MERGRENGDGEPGPGEVKVVLPRVGALLTTSGPSTTLSTGCRSVWYSA